MKAEVAARYIRWFKDISLGDVPLVGGKNASLGEMVRELGSQGIRVPDGFAVTAAAYRRHLEANDLEHRIRDILHGLDVRQVEELQRRAAAIRLLITEASLPKDVEDELARAYAQLAGGDDGLLDVAVRSSATAEDLPEASFAGQQETFLNVRGRANVLASCKACFASLFTDRAISYRADQGFDQLGIALSVGVQRMVRSDLGAAGVMFTLDTETGFREVVLINAAYGLGETVVSGSVNPDEIYVFKPTLLAGKRPIIRKRIGRKEIRTIYDEGGGRRTLTVPVPEPLRSRLCLADDDILQLARWACKIEEHYSRKRGMPTPMDIEWAKDGRTGEIFIVQARPETVASQRRVGAALETYELDPGDKARARLLATGRAVGTKIAQGQVRVIRDVADLGKLRAGEVLVTERTDPDWEPAMKLAAAIVTERGGRTCHAAIVSRELGVPAVVGAENVTSTLKDGQMVTVSCAEGDTGHIYDGKLVFVKRVTQVGGIRPTFTNIMLNVGDPDEAMRLAQLPNDGVGLARMEFIINNAIKIHPMALVRFETLPPGAETRKIAELTAGYDRKPDYFVDKLAEGVATIAAAFYPKDVIVRFSDFKTNEYAGLLGGKAFEPTEENPMLGFRGAARYDHPNYREAFALECAAIRKVRGEMGLVNLKVMIPFCRTVAEGRQVVAAMAKNGLVQGKDALEVYVMCEIPSNAILAKEFAEVFDGFSIGSNDLTQLVLGVDRDSEIVAGLFDERNPAVIALIAQAIEAAHAANRKIGICGQAPSDYPDFAAKLVDLGIDSVSLNPDAVLRTAKLIGALEDIGHDR